MDRPRGLHHHSLGICSGIQPGISFMYSIVKGTCTHDFVSSFSNCTGHLYPDSVSLLSLSLFPCFYLFIYLFISGT